MIVTSTVVASPQCSAVAIRANIFAASLVASQPRMIAYLHVLQVQLLAPPRSLILPARAYKRSS